MTETENDMFNTALEALLNDTSVVEFKDLTPEQQQEQHKLGKEGLVEYHKGLKKLETLKQDSIKLLVTDPDKQYKLTDALSKTHGDILDINSEEHDVSVGGLPDVIAYLHPIVEHKCNIQHDSTRYRDYYGKDYHYNHIEFITENRNNKVYTTGDIFDSYKKHPEQKRLVKGGHVNKRLMKKQKTVFQHLNTLVQAKGYDNLVKRMEAAEQNLKQVNTAINMLQLETMFLKQELNSVMKEVHLYKQRVRGVEVEQELLSNNVDFLKEALEALKGVDSTNQRKFYLMYKGFEVSGVTLKNAELSKLLQVNKRTIQRWKNYFGFN